MLVAFSRFFLCGEAAVARFCSRDGRKRRQGASLHGFSVAFGVPLAAFLPFFALRRSFSGLSCRFEAFREAPWSRFLTAREENTAVRPPSGVFRRGIADRSGRFGVIAFVRPRANRRLGGAYRCFGVANCSLVSAKCHLCVRGPSCSKAFLCRFVANTCGFLVRAHGVR